MLTPEKIILRNKWLLKFFKTIFPDKIIIANTLDNPAVIYNYDLCLSCYVQNFELRFMDKSREGNLVYSLTLSENLPEYDVEKILQWHQNSIHRHIYRARLKGHTIPMYLSGYNFLDREKQTGRYPVFSRHNPKIYMTKANADKVIESLNAEGYDATIC